MGDDQSKQYPVVMSPMQATGSYMVMMTDTGEPLNDLEMSLRGLEWGPDGKMVRVGSPLMNDKGIRQVLMLFKSVFTRNTPMSNLDDKWLESILEYIGDCLIIQLMTNNDEWDMKAPMVRNLIARTFNTMAAITLLRAKDEGERRFWKGTSQDIHHSITQASDKKGFLSNLFSKQSG